MGNYAASIVIPTHNRVNSVRVAIQSAFQQTVPVEVLVMDDASSDGTEEMVCAEFPQVRYYRTETPRGPTFQRNRGTQLATSEIVFPIDDDVQFVSPDTVAQTLKEFDSPRIGAVAIPFVNVKTDDRVHQRAPSFDAIYVVSQYVGASHALRRDLFLQLAGYRTVLFYMGEERDYCLRMLEAGYVVRTGRADPLHHFESPIRNKPRVFYLTARNSIVFGWHNVPALMLPVHCASTIYHTLRYAVPRGGFFRAASGLAAGFVLSFKEYSKRRPVPARVISLMWKMRRQRIVRLDQAAPLLEKMREILPVPQYEAGEALTIRSPSPRD